MDFIPSARLTSTKLREYLKIMEEGNMRLRKWAEQLYGTRKRRIFREKVFKGEILPDVHIPRQDYDKIMAVKAIEMDMLRAFAELVTARARLWSARIESGDQVETFHDLYQEANIAFLDGVYGYQGHDNDNTKFITYVWRVIDRRLRRHIENEKMLLVPPTGDGARELVRNYEIFKQSYGRYITFDEYVVSVELTEEERLILVRALAGVITEADLHTKGVSSDEERSETDYTCYDVSGKTDVPVDDQLLNRELSAQIQQCIKLAELSPFQVELLTSQQYHGWKADLARKYCVSRTRAGQAYNQALDKVKKIYRELMGEY